MKHMINKFKHFKYLIISAAVLFCSLQMPVEVFAGNVSLNRTYDIKTTNGSYDRTLSSVTIYAYATAPKWLRTVTNQYGEYDSEYWLAGSATSTTSLVGYTASGSSRTLATISASHSSTSGSASNYKTYVLTASDLNSYNRFMVTNTGSTANGTLDNRYGAGSPSYSTDSWSDSRYTSGSYSGDANAQYTDIPRYIEISSFGSSGIHIIPKEAKQLTVGISHSSVTVTCAYCGHSNGYIGTVRSTNWVKLLDANNEALATFSTSSSDRIDLSSYPTAKKVQLYSAHGTWGSWTCTDYVERWGHDCNNTNSGGSTGTGSCSVVFYGLEKPKTPYYDFGNLTTTRCRPVVDTAHKI